MVVYIISTEVAMGQHFLKWNTIQEHVKESDMSFSEQRGNRENIIGRIIGNFISARFPFSNQVM